MANDNDEIIEIYIEEATDILNDNSLVINKWQKEPENSNEHMASLQRELHTLKGGARMAEQEEISAVAHELESLLELLTNNNIKLNTALFRIIFSAHDFLVSMIEALKNKRKLPNTKNILKKLQTTSINIPISIPIPSKAHEPKKNIEPPIKQNIKQNIKQDTAGNIDEIIRVKSSLLEKMNNLAGENSINCVNLSQHISQAVVCLDETKSATNRMFKNLSMLKKISANKTSGAPAQLKHLELEHHSESYGLIKALFEDAHDISSLYENLSETAANTEEILRHQARISKEIQNDLLHTRMISFSSIVPRLRRIVNQLSNELKKHVCFKINFEEGQIDRAILEKIVPALEHILRNSLDHGVEPKKKRVAQGKAEEATICLNLQRLGSDVAIDITDDGAGIDKSKLLKKAITAGLVSQHEELSEQQTLRLILLPGLSTREKISQISGRGVGMDVVNTGIKQLGGSLDLSSELGVGSKFSIRLPFTSSLNHGLIFKVKSKTYAVQLSSIVGLTRIPKKVLPIYSATKAVNFYYSDKSYKIVHLGELLSSKQEPVIPEIKARSSLPLLILRSTNFEFAVLADEVIGNREIVIKSLGSQFNQLASCAGATILGSGNVVMILDPVDLGEKYKVALSKRTGKRAKLYQKTDKKEKPIIMVVDDSLTIRKITTNLLEQNNYDVIAAKDGIDAMQKMSAQIPDMFLVDMEMPRMDGFELSSYIRENKETSNTPIIMITSRTDQKHRRHATKIGINKFLGKPYQKKNLLLNIKNLLSLHQL